MTLLVIILVIIIAASAIYLFQGGPAGELARPTKCYWKSTTGNFIVDNDTYYPVDSCNHGNSNYDPYKASFIQNGFYHQDNCLSTLRLEEWSCEVNEGTSSVTVFVGEDSRTCADCGAVSAETASLSDTYGEVVSAQNCWEFCTTSCDANHCPTSGSYYSTDPWYDYDLGACNQMECTADLECGVDQCLDIEFITGHCGDYPESCEWVDVICAYSDGFHQALGYGWWTTGSIPDEGGLGPENPKCFDGHDNDCDGLCDIEGCTIDGTFYPPELGCLAPDEDFIPPITTASLNGSLGYNGWYVSPVTVTLTCTDESSGCNHTWYCLDQNGTCGISDMQLYTESFTVVDDGFWYVRYYSVDGNANAENIKMTDFKIDRTSPTGNLDINSGATYTYSTDVILNTWFSDPMSGVDSCRYKNDDESWTSWQICMNTKVWSLEDEYGTRTVHYSIKDFAGNVFQTSDDILYIEESTSSFCGDGACSGSLIHKLEEGNLATFIQPSKIFFDDSGIPYYYLESLQLFSSIPGQRIAYSTNVTFNTSLNLSSSDIAGQTLNLFGIDYGISGDSNSEQLVLYKDHVAITVTEGNTANVVLNGETYIVTLLGLPDSQRALIQITHDGIPMTKEVVEGILYLMHEIDVFVEDITFYGSGNPLNEITLRLGIRSGKMILKDGDFVRIGVDLDPIGQTMVKMQAPSGQLTQLSVLDKTWNPGSVTHTRIEPVWGLYQSLGMNTDVHYDLYVTLPFDEDPLTCSIDCGAGMYCGDGTCQTGETFEIPVTETRVSIPYDQSVSVTIDSVISDNTALITVTDNEDSETKIVNEGEIHIMLNVPIYIEDINYVSVSSPFLKRQTTGTCTLGCYNNACRAAKRTWTCPYENDPANPQGLAK